MRSKNEWKELVVELIKGLEFGVIQITIHQGEVVQIEKTEKHRFDPKRLSTPKE